jgi:hypothetical protein
MEEGREVTEDVTRAREMMDGCGPICCNAENDTVVYRMRGIIKRLILNMLSYIKAPLSDSVEQLRHMKARLNNLLTIFADLLLINEYTGR